MKQADMAGDRIPALDGIRGCAVLMVIVFHYWMGSPNRLLHLTQIGASGVDLFFVLSGFLITRILLGMRESRNIAGFYLRRAARILPVYVLFLLIMRAPWPYWLFLQNTTQSIRGDLPSYGHLWSLAVEEHFYLLWPFILLYSRARLNRVLSGIVATALVLRLVAALTGADRALGIDAGIFTLTRMDALAIGSALAVNQGWITETLLRRPRLVCIAPVLMLAAVSLDKFATAPVRAFRPLLVSLCYALIVGAGISVDRRYRLIRLAESTPLQFTGRLSYAMYVWHMVFVAIFAPAQSLAGLLLAIGATMACAWISWHLLERHVLAWGRYSSRRVIDGRQVTKEASA